MMAKTMNGGEGQTCQMHPMLWNVPAPTPSPASQCSQGGLQVLAANEEGQWGRGPSRQMTHMGCTMHEMGPNNFYCCLGPGQSFHACLFSFCFDLCFHHFLN
jgi:hypothetical protein